MGTDGKRCVHCGSTLFNKRGHVANELFDEDLYRKSKILRLVECQQCQRIADKEGANEPVHLYINSYSTGPILGFSYIEYEGVPILIDLLLQIPETYRHVLFNGSYSTLICKMAFLTVICDGYIRWSGLSSAGEFFEQEYEFYDMCIKSAIALLGYLATVLISCKFLRARTCLLGLLLAYSVRFLNIAAFMWTESNADTDEVKPYPDFLQYAIGPKFMWTFIYALFFISTARTVQVVQEKSFASSVILSAVVHLSFALIKNYDDIVRITKYDWA